MKKIRFNNGLLGTTHNLSLCHRFSSLQSYIVLPVGRPQSPDVQRPDNDEIYGEIATATATTRKLEENIRAMPRKMKITADNGLKIEKTGSTSPKTRFSGHIFSFSGLQA